MFSVMYPKNKYWLPLVKFLKKNALENQIFIGPEVLLYDFPKVFPYQILKDIRLSDYTLDYIVFHKKLPEDYTNDFLDLIQKSYKPVWGNHLFVVYKKNRSTKEKLSAFKSLIYTKINFKKYYKKNPPKQNGILITTYNRPEFLIKLLTQLEDRPEEILVVNDGSDSTYQHQYQQIKEQFPKNTYIDNPKNMGLVFSMNTGFSYFLADPATEWIHYFQDDVEIMPHFFESIEKVADKDQYPVVTGFYKEPHKIFGEKVINDVKVKLLRSASAQHFYVHRLYLMENMPIPNPYVGAPKPDKGKPGQGSDEDWWLLSWAPKSIVKRGKYVISIPGLAKSDAVGELSTWEK